METRSNYSKYQTLSQANLAVIYIYMVYILFIYASSCIDPILGKRSKCGPDSHVFWYIYIYIYIYIVTMHSLCLISFYFGQTKDKGQRILYKYIGRLNPIPWEELFFFLDQKSPSASDPSYPCDSYSQKQTDKSSYKFYLDIFHFRIINYILLSNYYYIRYLE